MTFAIVRSTFDALPTAGVRWLAPLVALLLLLAVVLAFLGAAGGFAPFVYPLL